MTDELAAVSVSCNELLCFLLLETLKIPGGASECSSCCAEIFPADDSHVNMDVNNSTIYFIGYFCLFHGECVTVNLLVLAKRLFNDPFKQQHVK